MLIVVCSLFTKNKISYVNELTTWMLKYSLKCIKYNNVHIGQII